MLVTEARFSVVKVVAISGSGRSGSTLLGLILSQPEGVFNLGQTRDLWSAWSVDAPCSCGHSLKCCPVYGELVPDVLTAAGFADARAARKAQSAFRKEAERATDWSDTATRRSLAGKHHRFLTMLELLLQGIATRTGANRFVDSSKSPEMALAFDLTAGVELCVINLLRDPRAVACSWFRKKAGHYSVWKSMRTWAARQRRLSGWSTALPGRFMQLRYEDFSAAPCTVLSKVATFTGLGTIDGLFRDEGQITLSWQGQHLFPPANEAVLAERRRDVVIRPAEAWKAPANRRLHRLARLGSSPEGLELYPDRI